MMLFDSYPNSNPNSNDYPKHHVNSFIMLLHHNPGFVEGDLAYFPNGESTIWGIYSECIFYFLGTP